MSCISCGTPGTAYTTLSTPFTVTGQINPGAVPRVCGRTPMWRLRPALPSRTFWWSTFPTCPMVAMHSTCTWRISPEGMRIKATYVMGELRARVAELGAEWSRITAAQAYTIHPLGPVLDIVAGGFPLAWGVGLLAWAWKAYRLIKGFIDLNNNRAMPV